jgi:hypothetical protein
MGRRRPESDPDKCLGFLADRELYGKCPACAADRRFAIAPLARRYGKFTHYSYVGQQMVCSTCGHKGIPLRLIRWDETPGDDIAY